jgi:hypothetical protein
MMLKNKFTSMILVIILMLQSYCLSKKTEVTLEPKSHPQTRKH